jgi:hypothetical protein
MPVYEQYRGELDAYETMYGPSRGKLALALDLLTDALVLAGQHGVFCQSARALGRPAMDVQMIVDALNGAKELVATAMEDLKQSRHASEV